jgi:OOP family OmpA-OmpF porin
VPTGETPSFVAEGAVRDAPHLSLGGSQGPFYYAAMGGFSIRGGENPSALIYGAGAGVTLLEQMLTVSAQGFASTDIQDGYVTVGSKRVERTDKTNAEVMLEVRVRPLLGLLDGLSVGAYGGPGLSQAIGTPAFRAGGMIRWDPFTAAAKTKAATADADGDTVPDTEDPCPYEAGGADATAGQRGCPSAPAAPPAPAPPAKSP